jgi:hypothetical protein
MEDFIDIGPECFATADATVISYKGDNYYRACDVVVGDNEEGGQKFCVKRVGHPGKTHEAYDGATREEGMAIPDLDQYALFDADRAFIMSQLDGETKSKSVRAAISGYISSLANSKALDFSEEVAMGEDLAKEMFINPRLLTATGSELTISIVTCVKCGCLVVDTEVHERWHSNRAIHTLFGI